ncbi:MAG: phenylalanine--tRNA ligase subunit beta [Candidatus Hydrogenedentota bacterium]|nr:MAG: phenylalanine--tRNA ligase subunit beta [Candidatus Hydrogenedentota bacterium]
MLVSLNWLKELVHTDVALSELANMLTMAGIEVEGVENIKPDFEKVDVGRILRVSRHPNADKLVLCNVDVGKPHPLRIVCGASNMKEGDKVPVALVGAQLAGGSKVKKTKIRGEVSEGMLCSERELGLGDDHSGIMILPPDAPVGKSFEEALGLSDIVVELGITPNRPDCLSMLGVAREVAAITGARVQPPHIEVQESGPDINSLTSITIEDDIACPRYAARIVSGVKTGPSPTWMQQRLLKAGLRPLNNVVDVTNYVLIELGHPLHAFDYDKLDEHRIVVRRARRGESVVTLDGENRTLSEQMLVIADAESPVAVAGVMGGANSEVTDQTTNVLIESAYFDPMSIRRTSKALDLSTEASYRFERGTDHEMVTLALDRAAALMAELAGGRTARGRIDCFPRSFAPVDLRLRHGRVKKILGIEIPSDTAVSILASLGFEIVSDGADAVQVRAPSYRPDVKAEIDLIEEVARIYGYENVVATYPRDNTVMKRGVQTRSYEDECKTVFKSCGFSEIITLSFGLPADMVDFSDCKRDPRLRPISMKNPLTEDASVLRTTLIPGLLQTVRVNINAGNKEMKVFETGKVYWPAAEQVLPEERTFVCAATTGLSRPMSWRDHPAEVDFFEAKGVAETLLQSLGYTAPEATKESRQGFHPGACADIVVHGETVGTVGEIHPDLLQKYGIGQKVCVIEIDLSALESLPPAEHRYEKISRFPYSDRDLAVVVDEHVEAAALASVIATAGGKILRRILLFDVYRGEQVGEGRKSLAFSLRFQSNERTLTDQEITGTCNRIVERLEERFNAKLRT